MGARTTTLAAEREAVAAAARRLAADGLVIGTGGNVSSRSGEHVVVTPTGAVLGELAADELAVVDLAGDRVDGTLAPTSELALHLGIYRQNEGAGAVVHTHAPVATALSCVLEELPAIHYGMIAFGGPVRVAPYRTFGTDELAAVVAEALAGRTAALMQNHGAVAWGVDLAGALETAIQLEWMCTLYWRARMIGQPSLLSDEQLADVVAVAQRRGYGRKGEHDA